ncbi:hypothetical protein [Tersicoccus sp. Bi-70]|uniref:hypothetical protein n=1 Tax=Tersicoccus sp. Bi-70 TaxID=1897634 RepID=UPI0009777863|nr:hypothetical protein [Tersicoccus sp. Bi-70]OMH36834.1 hypothetical protein BGP79_13835 [Tersicoccus sp. Bi-70]
MSDDPLNSTENPTQYATRRERRAAERAAEARATGAASASGLASAEPVSADEVDDDGVAFGAGAALTREEYEARMAELADQAGEHAVSLSRHGVSAAPASHGGEVEGAEHAGPEHVDPQVRAEQEALAARAAALNAAQRGTPAGPAVTDSPVTSSFAQVGQSTEPPLLDQPHNLGAVTPLRYEHDPAFDFPVIAPPTTSQVFLHIDPETGTAQPMHPGVPGSREGTRLEGTEASSDLSQGVGASDAATPTAAPEPAGADTAAAGTPAADRSASGPATGWVPTADLLEANAPAASADGGAASAPPVPVGAADAAGLDPLDSRTARQGRRSWVGALIGGIVVVVAALAVVAVLLFVH